MTWILPEPMLTIPVSVPDLRPGCAAEPKWDGFRALVSVDAGQVVLRSRRGTEMRPSFPEVVAGAVHLPDATALDGELVVQRGTSAAERSGRARCRRAGWRHRPAASRATSTPTSTTSSGSTSVTFSDSRLPHPAENDQPVHG
ncbi:MULTISPECIES: ATP-dependent DNA ligase [Streptomyces]|uniref:ATP-dependent DNA ligase family profile domain-containing protein n=1 Tax=Streptomyces doebereineriae TaxID=3075528 RepID=A0ABU2VQ70_9ACTN|nr:hypothetical protein [Streptomyces sp. DSM 41640]MDT0487254.1 hypothetical protein [Streptomyces sp. DSM 41640]